MLDDKSTRKAKEAFYQESYYFINQLLLSGRVLFQDSLSRYINQIADHILRHRPALRKALRIYVIKSPSVNAFTTNNGLILVNMGLFAHLDNEAQLAFVLCHEISHYIKKHPLDVFLEGKRLENEKQTLFQRQPLEGILTAKNQYSREKEQEADLIGLELFRTTGYQLEAAVTAFDVLARSARPFGEKEFEPDFLNSTHLSLPEDQFLPDSIPLIKEETLLTDTDQSTHPQPDDRKEILRRIIEDMPAQTEGYRWLLGERHFRNVQKIARYESCFLHLSEKRYELAIYTAYLLLQDDPESLFLKKIIAQSLYGLAKYANSGKLWDVHQDFGYLIGPARLVSQMVEKLKDEELSMLALSYIWKVHQAFPQDVELELMGQDLMMEMGKYYLDGLDRFLPGKDARPGEVSGFWQQALREMMTDSAFRQQMTEAWAKARVENARVRDQQTFDPPGNTLRDRSQKALKGYNLGLDNVVFVDPYFQHLDERKKRKVEYIASAEAEGQYIQLLKQHAGQLGLNYQMLSTHYLKREDIRIFQDVVLLNEWVNQISEHDGLEMVSILHEEVQQLTKKYGTSTFVWTGGVSMTQARSGKALVMLSGILLPVILPYSLWYVATPNHDTLLYTMVYDLKTGKNLLLYPKWLKMKDHRDVLNSATYDLIFQLKQGKN